MMVLFLRAIFGKYRELHEKPTANFRPLLPAREEMGHKLPCAGAETVILLAMLEVTH